MLLNPGLPGGMQRVVIGTRGEIRQEYGETGLKLFQSDLTEPQNLELPACREDPVVESFRMAIDDFAGEIVDGKKSEPSFQSSMHLFDLLLQGLGR